MVESIHSAAGGVWNAMKDLIDGANCNSISIIAFESIYPKCVLTLVKIRSARTPEKSEPTAETGIDGARQMHLRLTCLARAQFVPRQLLFPHAKLLWFKVRPIYAHTLSARTTPVA